MCVLPEHIHEKGWSLGNICERSQGLNTLKSRDIKRPTKEKETRLDIGCVVENYGW